MKDNNQMNQTRGKSAGVSMVELMIALAIMAVAIMGVMAVILHTIKTKEKMRELDIVKQAAATRLEQLRGLSWTLLGDSGSAAYADFSVPELPHPTGIANDKKAYGRVVIKNDLSVDPTPNLLDLEVTIFWIGVNGLGTYSARSMYTQ